MVPYGGFWRRVVAYIIDSIVLNIALGILGAILGIGMMPMTALGANPDLIGGAVVLSSIGLSFLLNWLYFAVLECSSWQATVGKLVMGLVVTDQGGERIGFGRATGRYFAKILSSLILLVGFIMVAFTERKQGLHDLIAGTLVYETRDPRMVVSEERVFA
jgi:Predicted membrane protein/domain